MAGGEFRECGRCEDAGLLFAGKLAEFSLICNQTESPCGKTGAAPRKRREFGEADARHSASSDVLSPPKDGTDGVGVAFLRSPFELRVNGGREMGKDADNFLPDRKGMLVHGWCR